MMNDPIRTCILMWEVIFFTRKNYTIDHLFACPQVKFSFFSCNEIPRVLKMHLKKRACTSNHMHIFNHFNRSSSNDGSVFGAPLNPKCNQQKISPISWLIPASENPNSTSAAASSLYTTLFVNNYRNYTGFGARERERDHGMRLLHLW